VTVGAAGTGGPAPGSSNSVSAGGSGGTSSFGSFLSATGGGGAPGPVDGTGGSGSGGNLNAVGSRGSPHFFNTGGVTGGNPVFVFNGGFYPPSKNSSTAATGHGCGGSGVRADAIPPGAPVATAGGAGSVGIVIVEEFY